jgi:nicotinamide mononucleotide transporter
MNVQTWFSLLIEQIKETAILQWIAVLFGVVQVLLARVNNVWLYPTGIIASVLSIILLVEAQLYAESMLNLYYVVMSIYGWIYWITKRNLKPVKISYTTRTEWIITFLIVFGGWAILFVALKYFTNSNVPLIDAWVSATAWAGMWLLARRKIENWILLNISNAFAIPLLFYKNLPLFALLTMFLFGVAIWGFFEWKKIYKADSLQAAQL